MDGSASQDQGIEQQEANHLELSGVVYDVSPLSYTPGGIPFRYFTLEHRSRQIEAGVPREVVCRIRVDMRGEALLAIMHQVSQGTRAKVSGFLARAGFREDHAARLVLHAQTLILWPV